MIKNAELGTKVNINLGRENKSHTVLFKNISMCKSYLFNKTVSFLEEKIMSYIFFNFSTYFFSTKHVIVAQ